MDTPVYRRNDRWAVITHDDGDLYVHKIVDDSGLYPVLLPSGRWEYPAHMLDDESFVRHVLTQRWPTLMDVAPTFGYP